MNLRNIPSYNVGLDIGTGSVGWAVTDENGNLCHFKNRPTWGSRIFPSANTAAETRLKRGQRRRYDRRRQRLDLLQSLFDEEMTKVDPEFFIRLRQSKLRVEDREEGHREYRYPFFNSSDFTERMYYQSYPTIYHLRKHLIESDQQEDLRLIYLAFHNIVKTRGNFLYQDTPSLSAKDASMSEAIEELLNALVLWADAAYDFEIDEVDSEKLRKVFEDSSLTRAEKKDEALKVLTLEDKKIAKELINAVLGYKANFNTIFKIEAEKSAFSFDNDEQREAFIASVPDEGMALYEALQKAYSAYILMDIIEDANGKSVSYSMVAKFNKYGEDLKTLKDLVKEYCPTKYFEFFRGEHYDAPYQKDYDKSKAKGYTKYNEVRGAKYDDFKKEVENLFKDTAAISDSRYKEMMTKFANGKFLRRLKTSDNGSIPFQLHLEEMNAIIDAQERFYPFLSEIRHKLNSLVTFRIPYYVGPLTQKSAALDASGKPRFAWSKRQEGKEGEKIYPWNWEDIIDKGASAREFIQRMTGTCTYLYGEPVLPKCSLLYEKFCVLNELNGARWSQDNDKWYRFDAEDRLSIYEELFERYKSVS
ncbi:MAG: type II CRISPR RNA-guided endonuclease Cas9, partial [Atopobium sp.]|nr:type II CRISPR RNA-guided endonuclease Cas9 [Atopobium sp.]